MCFEFRSQFQQKGGSSMTYKNIILEVDAELAVITINRPDVLNALNYETIGELIAAFGEVERSDARVLIFTGAGSKAFVAGADINELRVLSPRDAEEVMWRAQNFLFDLEKSHLIVIMAINGYALGGGCELAMAGDIRIASDKARLGQPEVKLGLIPGFGGTQRLTRLVGMGQAMRLVLGGEHITAQEARDIGLVDVVVCHKCGTPVERCEECDGAADTCHCEQKVDNAAFAAARALAEKILANGPVAVEVAKRCIRMGAETTIYKAGAYEMAQFGLICATKDKEEGTSAFLEKRKPEFTGR
jgi:enoyl-CoA hydratase